jgi:hypothetical protein
MSSLDIRTIQPYVNQTQPIWLPDFSEILDISYDITGSQLNILYQYNYDLAGTNQKMFNIWLIDSTNIISPPSDFYKFFGTTDRRHIEINLANANGGRIIPHDEVRKLYIFIEEIKTIAENRDEKLKEIL